jgi:hypothetical protein
VNRAKGKGRVIFLDDWDDDDYKLIFDIIKNSNKLGITIGELSIVSALYAVHASESTEDPPTQNAIAEMLNISGMAVSNYFKSLRQKKLLVSGLQHNKGFVYDFRPLVKKVYDITKNKQAI